MPGEADDFRRAVETIEEERRELTLWRDQADRLFRRKLVDALSFGYNIAAVNMAANLASIGTRLDAMIARLPAAGGYIDERKS